MNEASDEDPDRADEKEVEDECSRSDISDGKSSFSILFCKLVSHNLFLHLETMLITVFESKVLFKSRLGFKRLSYLFISHFQAYKS